MKMAIIMDELVKRVINKDVRAAARLIRLIDDNAEDCVSLMKDIYPYTGNSFIIGITGAPGAGKSTLTNQLITAYREQDKTVGVIAVDPTSPFSGGAILGDRIRMQKHSCDSGVFIRSTATRGALGGLSKSVFDTIKILDAYGKNIIIVETVGVGQDEVDIVQYADVSIVVTVPGLGDDIQAMKAGIMEIADIFVINKSDRPGTDKLYMELEYLVELKEESLNSFKVEIIKTIASEGKGINNLVSAILRYKDKLEKEYTKSEPNRERFIQEVRVIVKRLFDYKLESYLEKIFTDKDNPIFKNSEKGIMNPYILAEKLLKNFQSSINKLLES